MIAMPGIDVSINMMSLFAFILVLGIVVDDAIVVGENIYAHQEMNKSPVMAAVDGAKEIGMPVLITILTTTAAFIPFYFVPGTTGKFFRSILTSDCHPVSLFIRPVYPSRTSGPSLPSH